MSIPTAERLSIYRAGKSLFGGVRHIIKIPAAGGHTAKTGMFCTVPEPRFANRCIAAEATGAGAAESAKTPNQQRIVETFAALERALGKLFWQHPIDLSRPVVLRLHANRIAVINRHLDGARIEAKFNDRPNLQRLVHRIDVGLRAEAGLNASQRRATTLTIGPNGITAALQPC